jgi:nucleotidyltransferase substrate binding protein (TIGR01987 family)
MSDIRWIQRFDTFTRALAQLEDAVTLATVRPLSELERQGLIQGFEFTHELAWKTLKDFLEEQGNGPLYGSKDTTREAFRLGLIQDGDRWMKMITSRNRSSHTYDSATAAAIAQEITENYCAQFTALRATLAAIADGSR